VPRRSTAPKTVARRRRVGAPRGVAHLGGSTRHRSSSRATTVVGQLPPGPLYVHDGSGRAVFAVGATSEPAGRRFLHARWARARCRAGSGWPPCPADCRAARRAGEGDVGAGSECRAHGPPRLLGAGPAGADARRVAREEGEEAPERRHGNHGGGSGWARAGWWVGLRWWREHDRAAGGGGCGGRGGASVSSWRGVG